MTARTRKGRGMRLRLDAVFTHQLEGHPGRAHVFDLDRRRGLRHEEFAAETEEL